MRVVVVLVFATVLLAAALLAYPPLLEGSSGECSALEQRVSDLVSHDSAGRLTVNPLYGSSSSSPSGAAFAKDHYPLLPAEIGCAVAYWKTALGAELPAAVSRPAPPQPSSDSPLAVAAAPQAGGMAAVIARDITPNGDPISPGPFFTLPMNTVAIRVEYPGSKSDGARFQLLQGRGVIAACVAERRPAGTAWCRFTAGLRKGNYSIALTVSNRVVGQFPFTVLGN
jgi:hypothetical protein